MKFYEKIIGINKQNPNQEMKIEFNNNGFEFDKGLKITGDTTIAGNLIVSAGGAISSSYVSTESLSLGNTSGPPLVMVRSASANKWDWKTAELGTLLTWDFNTDKTIFSPRSTILSLGTASKPFNAYFNFLLPAGTTKTIGTTENRWTNIYSSNLNSTNATLTTANITTANITTLQNASVESSSGGSSKVAGLEVSGAEYDPKIRTAKFLSQYKTSPGHSIEGTNELVISMGEATKVDGSATFEIVHNLDLVGEYIYCFSMSSSLPNIFVPYSRTANSITCAGYSSGGTAHYRYIIIGSRRK